MNKGKYFILPDGVNVKEIQKTMYVGNDGWAYPEERTAEYSIAIGLICECGEYIEGKTHTVCDKCRYKNRSESYNKLEEVNWDGETPLTLYREGEYFYDIADIENYCESEDIKVEDLMLVLCVSNDPPYFDLNDYCIDQLPEDYSIYDCNNKESKYTAKEIEELVNKFLEDVSPISWVEGDKRVSIIDE